MQIQTRAQLAPMRRGGNWVPPTKPGTSPATPVSHLDTAQPVSPCYELAPGLRRHLLCQSGVGSVVVQRLEAAGLGSFEHLMWCLSPEAAGHPTGLADGLRNRRRALLRALQSWDGRPDAQKSCEAGQTSHA